MHLLASRDQVTRCYSRGVGPGGGFRLAPSGAAGCAMTKSTSEIIFVRYGAGFEDMPRRAADISKIQRLIGYEPVLDLPEMLERVIAYERDWEP